MAPKVRSRKAAEKTDSGRQAEPKEAKDGESQGLLLGGLADRYPFIKKHATLLQLAVISFVCGLSVLNLYLNPPDRYNYVDSYRAPALWYKQLAKEYDHLMEGKWNYTLPQLVAKELHDLHIGAGIKPSEAPVLDVGVGTGLVGRELRSLGFSHIVGLDLVGEMVTLATEVGAYELFLTADAEALPTDLLNETFQSVLCVGTTGYLARGLKAGERDDARLFSGEDPQAVAPDPERVRALLVEWLRLLKPGGVVGMTVESSHAAVWEAEQRKLEAEGLWTQKHPANDVPYLPTHELARVREERSRIYFYAKQR
eukprot:TRINITY_DN126167_c0_g1_i1.p1 TRINITY_DN126167_c0_g1~~TRINITY_DN126167_c0_g1_i1.p1  ORF type:complete len:312 (-),score=41.18 TRINITY_DN126167_c0_g1_i1:13-948(-)